MTKDEIVAFISCLEKWSIAFGIIVAIGVGGEAVATWWHWIKEKQLHKIEEEERRAQELAIAEAKAKAAEANRIAESERLERMKIEERLAPRMLSPVQQANFVTVLRQHAPQDINIVWSNEPEPARLGNMLANMCAAAQWKTGALVGSSTMLMSNGIAVEVDDKAEDRTRSAASALVATLKSYGLAVDGPTKPHPMTGAFQGRPNDSAKIWLFVTAK